MKEIIEITYVIVSIITFIGLIKAYSVPEDKYKTRRQVLIITLWIDFILLFIAQIMSI